MATLLNHPLARSAAMVCGSVVGFCFGVLVFSAGVGSLIVRFWDPFGILLGFMCCGIGVLILCAQYLATFRNNKPAGIVAASVVVGIGALIVIAIVAGNVEIVLSTGFDRRFVPFGIPILAAGIVCLVAGLGNLATFYRFKHTSSTSPIALPSSRRFKIKEMLALVLVFNGIFACTTAFVRSERPRFAEHVEASQTPNSLPTDATDVNYCHGYRGTFLCEFSCSEQAFCDWVKAGIGSIESQAANVPISAITTPISITRYTTYAYHKLDEAVIENGLVYEWHKEDRGTHAVYDRDAGRGYYDFHAH